MAGAFVSEISTFIYPPVNSHNYGTWTIEFDALPTEMVTFHSKLLLVGG